ncbi:hypothetical protein ACWCYK_31585 [Streptomyces lydicamycinicus]
MAQDGGDHQGAAAGLGRRRALADGDARCERQHRLHQQQRRAAPIKADSKLGTDLDPAVRQAVGDLARQTDFSMFEAADIDNILELHATTPHHVRRFPKQLKPRPAADLAPVEQRADEAVWPVSA